MKMENLPFFPFFLSAEIFPTPPHYFATILGLVDCDLAILDAKLQNIRGCP